ncbi:DUF429 domain-containing protein [Methanococcoides methylutens]|uniref:DUF429 domain-containing protein n=1 Tax=Methanococcoides methylutens MM1 TaxID=1434104 RepID=A0A0E3WZ82_METMT|nr:DUF429 domain-containing protein [Methanococcoides methylutens]AKB84510.1 hypothetical protein MCMEM_0457 [Methanococcoides methylutens MM1]
MNFIGVDGCKGGWFAIRFSETNDIDVEVFSNISNLWEKYNENSLILIDIPIGLREKHPNGRSCDVEARKILGAPRQNSVFPVPGRQAIHENDYESACSVNEKHLGKRIPIYAWGIVPKIREVDNFLLNNHSAREYIMEIHPELCFNFLAGRPMQYSKKDDEGITERLEVLKQFCPSANEIFQSSLSRFKRKEVAEDDILDALSAAITAKLGCKYGFSSIPRVDEFDSKGLPMRMVYFDNHIHYL